jgi:hypothetical protein
MNGLLVSVYRNADLGDSTNGGATSKFTKFVLTGPGIPGIFRPSKDAPELRYCVEDIGCGGLVRRCARPVDPDTGMVLGADGNGGGVWMFGGNYVGSSDSRMPQNGLNGDHLPIPVHDRCETWEQYRRFSQD